MCSFNLVYVFVFCNLSSFSSFFALKQNAFFHIKNCKSTRAVHISFLFESAAACFDCYFWKGLGEYVTKVTLICFTLVIFFFLVICSSFDLLIFIPLFCIATFSLTGRGAKFSVNYSVNCIACNICL
mgnify:FL=1